jgi:hypothetical protein
MDKIMHAFVNVFFDPKLQKWCGMYCSGLYPQKPYSLHMSGATPWSLDSGLITVG